MNILEILDTIYENGSTEYQTRVPEATRENLADIGTAILSFIPVQNEFLSALVDRIAMTVVHNKRFKNPLASLKKGSVPLGSMIQEIYANPATTAEYTAAGADLLSRSTPDVKALYHKLNRQDKYKLSISVPQLQKAFTSFSEMEKLINEIINTLYSGDNMDEFILMKNIVSAAILNDHIKKITVSPITSAENIKKLVKAINTTALYMTFPSTAFNAYALVNDVEDDTPVTTWTPFDDQILIIRGDVMTDINIELLATAFNMSKTDFLQNVVVVDKFNSSTECYALLCDRSFFQVYDNLERLETFDNGSGLHRNYFYHHWQTYSISHFCNAVAFIYDILTIDFTSATIAINATKQIVASTVGGIYEITYKSSKPTVATVDEYGLITAVSEGTCDILVTAGTTTKKIAVTVPTGQ